MSKFRKGDLVRQIVTTDREFKDNVYVVNGFSSYGAPTITFKGNDNFSITESNWELVKDEHFVVGCKYYHQDQPDHILECIWTSKNNAVIKSTSNNSEFLLPNAWRIYYRLYVPPVTREVAVVLSKDGTVTAYDGPYIRANERSARWVNALARKKFTITEGEFDV